MGIDAGIGLQYMMNDVLPYIKKNDIIVLVPEYEHFYKPTYYGETSLVSILFDVFPQGKQFISVQQWLNLLPYVFIYSATKIKLIPRIFIKRQMAKSTIVGIYDRYSFNNFGDAYIHWDKASEIVNCGEKSSGKETVNPFAIGGIKEFKNNLQKKGAKLIMLPPVYQECTFNNKQYVVSKIQSQLKDNKLEYLTPPLRYMFADNLFYNSVNYLNKQGVDLRTARVIEDLTVRLRGQKQGRKQWDILNL